MSKISVKEFRAAMVIIGKYCDQIQGLNTLQPNEIGCIVKLSKYGKSMQRPHNLKGKVVDWLEWHGNKDGLVSVKWEGRKKPVIMHVSQVEPITTNNKPDQ